jgi:hypothetical protein
MEGNPGIDSRKLCIDNDYALDFIKHVVYVNTSVHIVQWPHLTPIISGLFW